MVERAKNPEESRSDKLAKPPVRSFAAFSVCAPLHLHILYGVLEIKHKPREKNGGLLNILVIMVVLGEKLNTLVYLGIKEIFYLIVLVLV